MKVFVVVCALFAACSAAPNGYGGGMRSGGYGGGSTRSLSMSPAGHPAVRTMPNSGGYGSTVTYTAPGASYRAAPVTYAAPTITFNPPDLHYTGQSVAYATSGSDGSGAQSYMPSEGYSAPANPTVHNYQASSSSYSAPQSSGY